jgi:sugar phosphate isomerase/epimerase
MFYAISEGDDLWTRRHWLQAAGALTVGAALTRTLPAAAYADNQQNPLMQIGILMGTFGRRTLEGRLDAVKASGLNCVQLSMASAGLPRMPEEIPPALVGRIRREADARGITIASIDGTFNMSHPDAEQRRVGLRRLRVLAEACQALGTSKIHLCTGTRDRNSMWRRHADNDSPEAWRDMVACVREATAIAKQARVVLAFEPEVNNVVDSAKKARQLLDEIGSPHLKVTMDAANIFHAGDLVRMSEVLDQAFALVGKDIVLAHAKDLDRDGDAGHLAAGQGKLDYDRYLSLLHAYGFQGPLLLHGLSEAQVPGCVRFLRDKLARVASAPAKSVSGSN